MRYFHSDRMEAEEQATLPGQVGKTYAPHGPVTLARDVVASTADVDLVDTDHGTLAVAADAGAWAFVPEREAEIVAALRDGMGVGTLADQWPAEALDSAEGFVSGLFRRGLATLNGEAAVDRTMFRDSSNVQQEGRLVELLLSEKCNLACGYCLAGARQDLPHMARHTAFRAVDIAYATEGPESITFEFSGGEPFLRWDLMQELTDYIHGHPDRRGRRVYICIQTNGTLLDRERVRWLVDNEITLGLSLDGDPASHNVSRPQVNGGESFSKVMQGVDLLQRAGVGFGALVVLNRANGTDPLRLIDFLAENGIERVKINPIAFLGDARGNWDDLGLTQDQIIAYFKGFLHEIVAREAQLCEANVIDMIAHLISKRRTSRCLRTHCGAGDAFVAIAADGSIYPCGRATQSPGLRLGTVAEETDITAAGRRNPHIQAIQSRRPADFDDCGVCAYRALCQAGCSAQAFEKYGTVRHKTPECDFYKTMYPELMGWLTHDAAAMAHVNRHHFAHLGMPLTTVIEDVLPGRRHAA